MNQQKINPNFGYWKQTKPSSTLPATLAKNELTYDAPQYETNGLKPILLKGYPKITNPANKIILMSGNKITLTIEKDGTYYFMAPLQSQFNINVLTPSNQLVLNIQTNTWTSANNCALNSTKQFGQFILTPSWGDNYRITAVNLKKGTYTEEIILNNENSNIGPFKLIVMNEEDFNNLLQK